MSLDATVLVLESGAYTAKHCALLFTFDGALLFLASTAPSLVTAVAHGKAPMVTEVVTW